MLDVAYDPLTWSTACVRHAAHDLTLVVVSGPEVTCIHHHGRSVREYHEVAVSSSRAYMMNVHVSLLPGRKLFKIAFLLVIREREFPVTCCQNKYKGSQ